MTNDPDLVPTQVEAATTLKERVHALEAQVAYLQTLTHRASEVFRSGPTATALLDAAGQVVNVNESALTLLGATPGTLPGRRFASLLTPNSQGTFAALLERVQRVGGRHGGEVQLAADEVLDVLLEVAPLPEGASEGYQVTLTDVTAFKNAHRTLMEASQGQERQVQAANLRVRQLTDEFEQVVRLSEQQLQVRMTRADNFLTRYQQDAQPRYLTHAREALTQTQNLLSSLDQYMRARFMRTRLRRVNLEQVWREVLKDARPQLADRQVEITSVPLPVLEGDSQVFKIIMTEYLGNALKYTRTREQAQLRLLVEETDAEYRIGLQDNGVGFNMRQKDRAFELFGRLHADDQYEGTGLGLAVVRRLCERFGTRVWGEGKVNEGATFWFAWPKGTPGN